MMKLYKTEATEVLLEIFQVCLPSLVGYGMISSILCTHFMPSVNLL